MPNNSVIYNGALSGAAAAQVNERWITDVDAGDYVGQRNAAIALAEAVDAAIEPDVELTEADGQLMASVVNSVLSKKAFTASGVTDLMVLAIVGLFSAIDTQISPADSSVWATQASWAVDPATGNDNNAGTPAAPLATLGELNRRFANLRLLQNTTVQLVGNQAGGIVLVGTQLAEGCALTIQGTATNVDLGTISAVTPLGGGGTVAPWRLLTSAIDWTVGTNQRIRVTAGGNTGAVAPILQVVAANMGEIAGLALEGGSSNITPTVGMTIALQSLSTCEYPVLLIDSPTHRIGTTPADEIIIKDLMFSNLTGGFNPTFAGPRIKHFGCHYDLRTDVGGTSLIDSTAAEVEFTACSFQNSAISGVQFQATGAMLWTSCAFIGGGTTGYTFNGLNVGSCSMAACAFNNAEMLVNGGGLTIGSPGLWIQNVTPTNGGALTIRRRGVVSATSTTSRCGGTGITGNGISVESGSAYLYNSNVNAKPTLAGSVSDTTIGGAVTAYAAIPVVTAANNAMMVVIAS